VCVYAAYKQQRACYGQTDVIDAGLRCFSGYNERLLEISRRGVSESTQEVAVSICRYTHLHFSNFVRSSVRRPLSVILSRCLCNVFYVRFICCSDLKLSSWGACLMTVVNTSALIVVCLLPGDAEMQHWALQEWTVRDWTSTLTERLLTDISLCDSRVHSCRLLSVLEVQKC